MKRILAGLALVAFGFSFALAADDPMASRYGNTLVIKGADGKEAARLYYNQDGTAVRKLADGTEIKGTWKMDGANLCFTQVSPPPKPDMTSQCNPFSGPKKVGDTWDVTRPDGTKLTVTLQQGRP
jgi:hypothetical protein